MSMTRCVTVLSSGILGCCLAASLMAQEDSPSSGEAGATHEARKDNAVKSTVAVGKPAPLFWTYNAAGQITDIREKYLQKKWLLVEFWSSKDKDRAKAEERLAALRKQYLADDRLLIFSVCVDPDFSEWFQYVDSQEDLRGRAGERIKFYSDFCWWQLSLSVNDDKTLPEVIDSYGLQTTPRLFLIHPDKTLAAGSIDTGKLQEVLTKHLGNAAK